ncbi:hypothetical protein V2K77_01810 [Pseudomonas alliivorans]|nr:hypothetical protein [Pseudomonas alliivorans]MEE4710203.1 hypothetical protein [Pseudomonas alliivorans]MEE4725190.1 hypothetical protein [Pseudomonas alliivorans]MEE4765949.1 hypothetical protein [Pseudomonas alliivorans]
MKQKKRDLEDWEKAECAALKAAIEARNRSRPKNERITQEQAGAALGMNQGSFSNYLNGRLALNLEFAVKVANLFEIPISAFSPRLSNAITSATADVPTPTSAPTMNVMWEMKDDKPHDQMYSFFSKIVDEQNSLEQGRTRTRVLSVQGSDGTYRKAPATPLGRRVKELFERIDIMLDEDYLDESDFDLLNSVLDTMVRKSASFSKKRNEHVEKH